MNARGVQMTDVHELKVVMEQMIVAEIQRLSAEADACVFALYDPNRNQPGPVDFECQDRKHSDGPLQARVTFDFEGVGVWYIAFRNGDTFSVRKVLLQIEDGRFKHGQVGTFEGFWEEFPQYVAEDRWVQAQIAQGAANDRDGISIAAAEKMRSPRRGGAQGKRGALG